MKTTAVVDFAAASAGRPFALEQRPWPEKSAVNFEAWLTERNITATWSSVLWLYEQYKSDCLGDGQLIVTLRVRLLDLETPYVLRASYGTVGAGVHVREGRVEYLAYELTDGESIDFGVITGAVWEGDVYSAEGDIIAPPAVTISGQTATVAEPVYGVLAVEVDEEMYEHPLTILARPPTAEQAARMEAGENVYGELYAAVAMLFCHRQIDLHQVEMPENFGTCDGTPGGSSGRVTDRDDDEETQYYTVRFAAFDYCRGSAVQGVEFWVNGEQVLGGEMVLPAGEHTIVARAPGYTPSNADDLTENDSFTLGG